jgi:hypothetical protein
MNDSKKSRPVVQLFQVVFHHGTDRYVVTPLVPEPSGARKAFRLQKETGDGQVYDVHLTDQGPRCNCKGFVRWGHCKHITMLRNARMLD